MQQDSPLLNLPEEPLIMIYREVLVSDNPISIEYTTEFKEIVARLQFLHVCRRIREEADAIFWVENVFQSIITDCEYPFHMDTFARKIGKQRAAMIKKMYMKHEKSPVMQQE